MRLLLERNLTAWGHEVALASDGDEANRILVEDTSLRMAILDWQMPGMDGFQLCYKIRNEMNLIPFYIILLTSRAGRGNTIEGFASGADEFIAKPFDKDVLHARIEVGVRAVEHQTYLVKCIRSLERNGARLELLLSHIPACPQCRRIQADNHRWFSVKAFTSEDFAPNPANLWCPECAKQSPADSSATESEPAPSAEAVP